MEIKILEKLLLPWDDSFPMLEDFSDTIHGDNKEGDFVIMWNEMFGRAKKLSE